MVNNFGPFTNVIQYNSSGLFNGNMAYTSHTPGGTITQAPVVGYSLEIYDEFTDTSNPGVLLDEKNRIIPIGGSALGSHLISTHALYENVSTTAGFDMSTARYLTVIKDLYESKEGLLLKSYMDWVFNTNSKVKLYAFAAVNNLVDIDNNIVNLPAGVGELGILSIKEASDGVFWVSYTSPSNTTYPGYYPVYTTLLSELLDHSKAISIGGVAAIPIVLTVDGGSTNLVNIYSLIKSKVYNIAALTTKSSHTLSSEVVTQGIPQFGTVFCGVRNAGTPLAVNVYRTYNPPWSGTQYTATHTIELDRMYSDFLSGFHYTGSRAIFQGQGYVTGGQASTIILELLAKSTISVGLSLGPSGNYAITYNVGGTETMATANRDVPYPGGGAIEVVHSTKSAGLYSYPYGVRKKTATLHSTAAIAHIASDYSSLATDAYVSVTPAAGFHQDTLPIRGITYYTGPGDDPPDSTRSAFGRKYSKLGMLEGYGDDTTTSKFKGVELEVSPEIRYTETPYVSHIGHNSFYQGALKVEGLDEVFSATNEPIAPVKLTVPQGLPSGGGMFTLSGGTRTVTAGNPCEGLTFGDGLTISDTRNTYAGALTGTVNVPARYVYELDMPYPISHYVMLWWPRAKGNTDGTLLIYDIGANYIDDRTIYTWRTKYNNFASTNLIENLVFFLVDTMGITGGVHDTTPDISGGLLYTII